MGDIKLFFKEEGQGEPLILLHGNGEDSEYFREQAAFFSKTFRVIAPDTRGHGLSPRGTAPFTLSQFADDLKDFMDEKEIAAANILGFSDGGNIALLFAMRYPEMVKKLILNGAILDPGGVKTWFQALVGAGYCTVCLFALFDKRAERKKEMLGLMARQPHIDPDELSAVTAPTLVIAGTRDLIKEKHTKTIAGAIPGAKLCFIEGDHFIALKESGRFNSAVMEFLTESAAG
jgi:pimeloyl-ACP methyl ester carboxylesterase